ncbi:prepilin-type N-terminal cleavage/methylation domain-containing protein, partial [Candidatus Saccharibacteria bacterium]|nr:prepilin-type N-terminal cleavage/methylation domain-containing protein [Candidatus Saccharibacteria bacterium]
MPKQLIKTKRGFTIIEVVLVLAIAGLIFMMVFIALPALQRSQRDTQRTNDMSRFMTQLTQYQS